MLRQLRRKAFYAIAAALLWHVFAAPVYAGDSPESVAPIVQSVEVDTDGTLKLTYNETLLDNASSLNNGNFFVKVDGQPVDVTGIAIIGNTVRLTLTVAPQSQQSVTITYLQGDPAVSDPAGNKAGNLIDYPVTNPDTVAPILVSAAAIGSQIVLTYNEVLNEASVPGVSNLYVKVNGLQRPIERISISGDSVRIVMQSAIEPGQVVLLTYLRGGSPICDPSGNAADNLRDQPISNPLNTAPPTVSSVTINGDSVQLRFSQTISPTSVPVPGSFAVKADGTQVSVLRVAVSGANVILTLYSAVKSGQTVTVDYAVPPISALKNESGLSVAAFSNVTAANMTDDTPPVLISAKMTGSTVQLTYSKALAAAPVPAVSSFAVTINGVQQTIANMWVNGTIVTLQLSAAIVESDQVLLFYSAPSVNYLRDASGNPAASLNGQHVANGSDTTPPQLVGALAGGSTVTLTYSEALSSASVPPASSFSAVVGSTQRSVSGVAINGSTVILTLAGTVPSGATVTLSYSQPFGMPIKDLNGNPAASFYNRLIGNSSDTTPPVLSKAAVNGNQLTLTYNEALSPYSVPPVASFYVSVNGIQRTISSVAIKGSVLTLTLASAVTLRDALILNYAQATNPLKDISGNLAIGLVNQTVSNQTDNTPPVLSSAMFSGATLTLAFDKALNPSYVPGTSSFTVSGGSYRSVTAVTVSGSSVVLTLSSAISASENVTVSYSPNYGSIQDLSGNAAVGFYSQPVANENDTTAPVLTGATANGSTITLTYNKNLRPTAAPAASQFSVKAGQAAATAESATVIGVSVSGANVTLTLQTSLKPGDTAYVTYSSSSSALTDAAGNAAASFSSYAVTVPKVSVALTSSSVNGADLTLQFGSSMLSGSPMPATGDFTVFVDGLARSVAAVRIIGSTVVLTLSSPTAAGQTVKVTYKPGAAPLRDVSGNPADGFAEQPVVSMQPTAGGLIGGPAGSGSGNAPFGAFGGNAGGSTATDYDVRLGADTYDAVFELNAGGQTAAVYQLKADALRNALRQAAAASSAAPRVVIPLNGNDAIVKVLVPAAVFDGSSVPANVRLTVETPKGSYRFPMELIDAASLAKQLGVDPADIRIAIVLGAADPGLAQDIRQKAESAGMTVLGQPVVYETHIEASGKQIAIHAFNQYMLRSLQLDSAVSAQEATVLWYDAAAKKLQFAPAVFTDKNGTTAAAIRHMSNGAYVAVKNYRTFADTAAHWANETIIKLASKQLINGISADAYGPELQITKAEFAALLVRALGLPDNASAQLPYTDVPDDSWFRSAVGAAYSFRIADASARFEPNKPITREEIAVMVHRALNIADRSVPLSNLDSAVTAAFKDLAAVSPESMEAITAVVKAGIFTGSAPAVFAPQTGATRAQAAVIIGRMLKYLDFIN